MTFQNAQEGVSSRRGLLTLGPTPQMALTGTVDPSALNPWALARLNRHLMMEEARRLTVEERCSVPEVAEILSVWPRVAAEWVREAA